MQCVIYACMCVYVFAMVCKNVYPRLQGNARIKIDISKVLLLRDNVGCLINDSCVNAGLLSAMLPFLGLA